MERTDNMPMILVILMGIWFGGSFLLVILGFINNSKYLLSLKKLINHLKNNHPEIYKNLGEPTMLVVAPQKIFGTLKFIRTFLRSSYDVNDHQLESMKSTTTKLLKRGYVLFGAGVAWFFTFPLFLIIAVKLTD